MSYLVSYEHRTLDWATTRNIRGEILRRERGRSTNPRLNRLASVPITDLQIELRHREAAIEAQRRDAAEKGTAHA